MKYILIFALAVQGLYAGTARDSLNYNFTKYLFRQYDFCDACGCSANGGGMGFSSMINENFIGVRYFYQSYSSRNGIFNNSPWIDEDFNTLQVWARIPVYKNIQISALFPYHFHNRKFTDGKQTIEGVGDITLLGIYTVYQTKADTTVYKHTLQAGAGIKAPVGKYNSENNGSVNQGFQVGTGSWDYLLTTEYVVKRKSLGLNAMLNYVFKTENNDNYQFGNQLNYVSTLFYQFETGWLTLVPQAGIAGEVYAANKQYREELPDTEGDVLFSKFGLEAGKGKFSFGINAMLPISQNLTGGRVEANYRWSVNLNYSL